MAKSATDAGDSEAAGERLIFQSAERNKGPILEVLKTILPATGRVLEIGAGSGQQTVFFAAHFAALTWQASEPDAKNRRSIRAWIDHASIGNAPPPLYLYTGQADWPVDRAEAVISINMIHIAPWDACVGLVAGAAKVLGAGGVLYFYGPFSEGGVHTSPGNADFDVSLKAHDPDFGLRDVDAVTAFAEEHGLQLERTIPMPSNNRSLIYRKS